MSDGHRVLLRVICETDSKEGRLDDRHPGTDLSGCSKQRARASSDLLRELLSIFIDTLLSAEADAACAAKYGPSKSGASERRNGYDE